jgi:hypothetical protein
LEFRALRQVLTLGHPGLINDDVALTCALEIDLEKLAPALATAPVPVLANGEPRHGDLIFLQRSEQGYRLGLDKWNNPTAFGPRFADHRTRLHLIVTMDFRQPMGVRASFDGRTVLDVPGALSSRSRRVALVAGGNLLGFTTVPPGSVGGVSPEPASQASCPHLVVPEPG